MKKILFIILMWMAMPALQAQEGILHIIHNNGADIGLPAGTSIGLESMCILSLQNNNRVLVTNATNGSASVGQTDIDITIIDANNVPVRHHVYGIFGTSLIPKDVIEDNIGGTPMIVISGIETDANGVSRGFILRLDQSATPIPTYMTYEIPDHHELWFHQVLHLQLSASLRNGQEQYAILATATPDAIESPADIKDFVLLLDRTSLAVNSVTRIDIGNNFGSMGYHQNKAGYKLIAETNNTLNSLCVGGSYRDFNNPTHFGIHITSFDWGNGNLAYMNRVVNFNQTNTIGSGWVHPNHLVFWPGAFQGRGSLLMAGGWQSGTQGGNLTPFFLSYDPRFQNVDADWFNWMPIMTGFIINGQFNSRIQVIDDEIFIGNNRGDFINLDNGGNIVYLKSITNSLRVTGGYPLGDFTFDPGTNLFHSVSLTVADNIMVLATMQPNDNDACCFMVRNPETLQVEHGHLRQTNITAIAWTSQVGGLERLENDPGITVEVACNFCNDNNMNITGPTEVWCQPVTYNFNGCAHADLTGRWHLIELPHFNADGNITNQTNNAVTINFTRIVNHGNPSNYVLRYMEEIAGEGQNCQRELATMNILFRNLDCPTASITGNNAIICQGNQTYAFTGCQYPVGTTYQWTLTNSSGHMDAAITGSSTGTSVNLNFATTTTNNIYTLTLTATFMGCTFTRTLQITHDPLPFTGVITGSHFVSCPPTSDPYSITNPGNANITGYGWQILPGGPVIDNVTASSVNINFNVANPGTYTLICWVTIGGCDVKREFTISIAECCQVANPSTNAYQASYKTTDILHPSNTYTGRTLGIHTSSSNTTIVLQEITNLATPAFSITELDPQGHVLDNAVYNPTVSNDFFQVTDFTESLTPGGRVVIGHKNNNLYIMEVSANGNITNSRKLSITGASGTLEATSITRFANQGTVSGYCILVNVNNGSNNRVFLVGLVSGWVSCWISELYYNTGNTVQMHAHKLVEYMDNGISKFIVLGTKTGGNVTKGFIMQADLASGGFGISATSVKHTENIYFSATEMPPNGIHPGGLVFGGSNNPVSFNSTTCATFLVTDYSLGRRVEKILHNFRFEVLDVKVTGTGNPVFLMLSKDPQDNASPYFYHLFELDPSLNTIPSVPIKIINNHKNFTNDHNPYFASKSLLDRTVEGGIIVAGQEENGADFVLCKTGVDLVGNCLTSFSLPVDATLDAPPQLAGKNIGSYSWLEDPNLHGIGLDALRTCCDKRAGAGEFNKCLLFHSKEIYFTPNEIDFCENDPIELEAMGNFDMSEVDHIEWNIDHNTNISTTSKKITHVFPKSNVDVTYNIIMTVYFKNGCSKTYVNYLNAHCPCQRYGIEADFTYSGCVIPISFFPTPHKPGATYHWDYGDGNTSDEELTNHAYALTGTYTVCLTIKYMECSQTICKTVIVGMTEEDLILQHCPFSNSNALWLDPGELFDKTKYTRFTAHDVVGDRPDYNSQGNPPMLHDYVEGDYVFEYFSSNGCLVHRINLHVEEMETHYNGYALLPIPVLCGTAVDPNTYFLDPLNNTTWHPDCPVGGTSKWTDINGNIVTGAQNINGPTEFIYECIDLATCTKTTVHVTFTNEFPVRIDVPCLGPESCITLDVRDPLIFNACPGGVLMSISKLNPVPVAYNISITLIQFCQGDEFKIEYLMPNGCICVVDIHVKCYWEEMSIPSGRKDGTSINEQKELIVAMKELGINKSNENRLDFEKVNIFPNPSTGLYNVQYVYKSLSGQLMSNYSITVLDITGKLVYSKSGLGVNSNETIDLSQFASGVYTAKITMGDNTQFFKLIKN